MPGVNTTTTLECQPASFTSDHRTSVYFAFISFFIVLGNYVTLAVICKKKRKKTTDLLLGVLAVTDLCIPILVFPLLIAYGISGRWSGGRPSCYLNAFASMFLLKFSMLIACVIAVDRFIAIDKPFIYRSKINLARVKIAVVIAAFYSITVSLVPLIGTIVGHARRPANWHLCFYHWVAERSHTLTSIYVVLNVVDTSIATLAVLGCNIGVIIYFLKKWKARKIPTFPSSQRRNDPATRKCRIRRGSRDDLKYARLMAVVSVYFLLCFLPIQVLIILYQYGGISLAPQYIVTYQQHIVTINLLLNPLLHALIRKQYRKAYWFLLRHPLVLCGRSTDHRFDFDKSQKDPSDSRPANLRELSFAVIAASRFRANGRRVHAEPHGAAHNSKAVPRIVEMSLDSHTSLNSTRLLSSFSSRADSGDLGRLSNATECSEAMPVNLLQVPSIPIRRASGTSYFSDSDSLPPSPSPRVTLPNFNERREETSAASDVDSDAGTICSHLADESRMSVPSIFSEFHSDETPQSIAAVPPPRSSSAQPSSDAPPDKGSQGSGSVEEESNSVETAWRPAEYLKLAQEIDGIVVKRSKVRKKKKT